jgi:plastocyanin
MPNRILRLVLLLMLLSPFTVLAAQAQDLPPSVEVVDFEYSPVTLTVPANTAVTFTNHGQRPHTVTDRGGTFDTNPIAPKASSSITFSVPGTYSYFCRINPVKMNGTIVVKPDAAKPAPVNRVQAFDPGLPNETLRFDPTDLTVPAGSTVLFANVGGKPHTLTADDGSFSTGVVPPGPEGGRFAGTTASLTLPKPGTFPFHCEIHPATMKGTLTVTGEARAGPAVASSAPRAISIDMKDIKFNPVQASVAPGGKVTWTNRDSAPHDATFDDEVDGKRFATKTFNKGESASLTAPTKPGSYSYLCSVHPAAMRAVLVVVGQNTADPTKGAAAAAPVVLKTGPGSGVSTFALATGVIAAFLGGFGISAFVRRRPT